MSNNNGQKLAGKVAVITGGSSGIGLASAKRFVGEGAHVVITGRDEKELKEAASDIKGDVTTVVCEITNLEDLDQLYAVVKEKHGHIDILFANAGVAIVARSEIKFAISNTRGPKTSRSRRARFQMLENRIFSKAIQAVFAAFLFSARHGSAKRPN